MEDLYSNCKCVCLVRFIQAIFRAIFRRLSARYPSLSTAGVNSENSERGDLDTCQLKRCLLFY